MTDNDFDLFQRNYWTERARSIADWDLKSIADPSQRVPEKDFVLEKIPELSKVLEIGCGSGFMTQFIAQKAEHVTAIDIQDDMLSAARDRVPADLHHKIEWATRNFHEMKSSDAFDVIVSARVFINFPSLDSQFAGLDLLRQNLRVGGSLLFLEGNATAFEFLNDSRDKLGLEPVAPSAVNLYLNPDFFCQIEEKGFKLEQRFDNGLYDAVTRVLIPALDGATSTLEKQHISLNWIKSIDWDNLHRYSRVGGGHYILQN